MQILCQNVLISEDNKRTMLQFVSFQCYKEVGTLLLCNNPSCFNKKLVNLCVICLDKFWS